MKIYPAIDLMDKRAVRLFKGKKERVKVYGDPLKIAEEFARYFNSVHIVDLDGAFSGRPKNLDIVKRIIENTHLNVEIGGGFRDFNVIEEAYKIGIKNVIIGTRAFDLDFLGKVTAKFKGITASIDVKGNSVFVKGWEEKEGISPEDAYRMLKRFVSRFVYTSIESDGTLTGVKKIKKFWGDEEFIYAGGVSSIKDIEELKEIGFSGVIVGKAIYENYIPLNKLKEVED